MVDQMFESIAQAISVRAQADLLHGIAPYSIQRQSHLKRLIESCQLGTREFTDALGQLAAVYGSHLMGQREAVLAKG